MEYQADEFVERANELILAGRRDAAVNELAKATRLINRYGPAQVVLDRVARDLFADAIAVRDGGDLLGAIALLTRSIELNPFSGETRAEHERLLGLLPPSRDLTTECLIFPYPERATRWYEDAIQTCLDFVVFNGVDGDILEFGVLGGWTARIFATKIRDMGFLCDLYLFDSFRGLPRNKDAIDRASYDVTRGVWREEMELPQAWTVEFGMPIEDHIAERLARIVSRSRIDVRKGFFSESLREPVSTKAAIVHMDCDLYSSTVEVFEALERDDVVQDGTIIMFDDWNCNRGNPAFGQRRAFAEFLARNAGRLSASHFFNYGYNCAAYIVHDLKVAEAIA